MAEILDDTPRKLLSRALRAALPRKWALVDHDASAGTITKPTVWLKQQRIEPASATPMGALLVSYVITIATPTTDERGREVELDDQVLELLIILDDEPALAWTSAEKVLVQDRYLGYDITVQLTTLKKE